MEKGTEIGFEIGYGKDYRTCVCVCVCVYMPCGNVRFDTTEMGFRYNQLEV